MPNKNAGKANKALTDRQQRAYDFLSHNNSGVLATVDPNGEPHGTVIYYAIEKDFNISFLTRTGTKKYDNLVRNNHLVLVVFEAASQTVAQVIGKAVEITGGYDINTIASAIFKSSLETRKDKTPPIAKLQAGEYAAFKIEPAQIRVAYYSPNDQGDHDSIFESIESFELRYSET